MGIFKFNWAKTRRRLKRVLFLFAVIVFIICIVPFFADHDREPTVVFLIMSMIIFGFYFGNFVSNVFLRQSKRFQTRSFIFLPLISIVGLMFLTAMFSGLQNPRVPALIVLFFLIVWFAFPLGLFLSLVYQKLKKQIAIAETAAAHSKSELQLLQSQLSPHFLFNTLNNLYGISLREPEKTPAMLLKLSELLRYSVYDAKDPLVPLKDEMNYLKNYIEFEKIRIGDRLDLKVDIEEFNMDNIRIAPMLLVVFVENAFKHAKNNLSDRIQIDISLKQWLNQVLFAVKNSHKDTSTPEGVNKHSGFGLQSTIKRLELLYPNAHDLKIEKDEDSFAVMLRVNIKRGPK